MAITANDLNLSIAVLVGSFGVITTLIVYIWNSMLKVANLRIEATNIRVSDQQALIKELSDISRNLEIMVRVHDVEIENLKKAS